MGVEFHSLKHDTMLLCRASKAIHFYKIFKQTLAKHILNWDCPWSVAGSLSLKFFNSTVSLFLRTHSNIIIDFSLVVENFRIFAIFLTFHSTVSRFFGSFILTCPRSSLIRTICQPIDHQQQRFVANRFAYELPNLWTHLGAYWWWELDFPFQNFPPSWSRLLLFTISERN